MKRLIIMILSLMAVSGCGIYSFSGTSIQPDVETITINFFEYKALRVNPTLSNDLTEALRKRFRQMTRLEQVEMDGDLEISGEITGYNVSASSISADEVATQNRLTITVKASYSNRKHPEEDFQDENFSGYADYDSSQILDAVESSLTQEIIEKIVEDIFNASVAQW